MQLYTKITIGLVAGILVGWVLHITGAAWLADYTDYIGKIFISLVKMVVVPLVLASLILGAANLGDPKKLGRMGFKVIGFFMMTTFFSVSIGITLATVFQPGAALPAETRNGLVEKYRDQAQGKLRGNADVAAGDAADVIRMVADKLDDPAIESAAEDLQKKVEAENMKAAPTAEKNELRKVLDVLLNMVPTNPVSALATGDMLAIIFFALFFGVCLTLIDPAKSRPMIDTVDSLNEVILKMVTLVMETAPYGVFALMVGVVASMVIDILVPLSFYGAVVLAGLFLHVMIVYIGFITFYVRKNPIKFLASIKEAVLLGFSTSSSSATLPVSMRVANQNLGISSQTSSFVLPLGATINMDGTALYQGVAAIFIAQVYGMELTMTQQLVMILTATLASVGAAGVPGAGMITLAVVLETANVPVEGIALIFGLDRLIDMFRTSVNIVGDLSCTTVMAHSEGETITLDPGATAET